jgi:hypothetical protein
MKPNNRYILTLSAVLILFLFLSSGPAWCQEKPRQVKCLGVSFQIPQGFSKPEKSGVDSYSLTLPATAKPGGEQMTIVLVAITKEMQESSKMTDQETVNYVKAVFLGAGETKGKTKKRSFLGKPVEGEVMETSIPTPSVTELYMLKLSGKGKLAVAFKYDKKMGASKAEEVMTLVSRTLKPL